MSAVAKISCGPFKGKLRQNTFFPGTALASKYLKNDNLELEGSYSGFHRSFRQQESNQQTCSKITDIPVNIYIVRCTEEVSQTVSSTISVADCSTDSYQESNSTSKRKINDICINDQKGPQEIISDASSIVSSNSETSDKFNLPINGTLSPADNNCSDLFFLVISDHHFRDTEFDDQSKVEIVDKFTKLIPTKIIGIYGILDNAENASLEKSITFQHTPISKCERGTNGVDESDENHIVSISMCIVYVKWDSSESYQSGDDQYITFDINYPPFTIDSTCEEKMFYRILRAASNNITSFQYRLLINKMKKSKYQVSDFINKEVKQETVSRNNTNQSGLLITARRIQTFANEASAYEIVDSNLDFKKHIHQVSEFTNKEVIQETESRKNIKKSGFLITARRIQTFPNEVSAYEIIDSNLDVKKRINCKRKKRNAELEQSNDGRREKRMDKNCRLSLSEESENKKPCPHSDRKNALNCTLIEEEASIELCESLIMNYKREAKGEENEKFSGKFYFVQPQERSDLSDYMFLLASQVKRGKITERDKVKSNRKKNSEVKIGYFGMRCRHCGGKERGHYFPSSCKNLQACPPMIYTHLMKCHDCPSIVKWMLKLTKAKHKEQVAAKKSGTQMAFFLSLWDRIHDINFDGGSSESNNSINTMLDEMLQNYIPLDSFDFAERKKTTKSLIDEESRSCKSLNDGKAPKLVEKVEISSIEVNDKQIQEQESSTNPGFQNDDRRSRSTESRKESVPDRKLPIPAVVSSSSVSTSTTQDQNQQILRNSSIDSDYNLVLEVLEEVQSSGEFNILTKQLTETDFDTTPNDVTVPNIITDVTKHGNFPPEAEQQNKEDRNSEQNESTFQQNFLVSGQSSDESRQLNPTPPLISHQIPISITYPPNHTAPINQNAKMTVLNPFISKSYPLHSSPVKPSASFRKKSGERKPFRARRSCSKIFTNDDDVLLVRGIMKYGKKWKQIWEEYEGLQHIKQSSLKDRARSRRFQNLLERARLDSRILDDPGALYDFGIKDTTPDEDEAQSIASPMLEDNMIWRLDTANDVLDNLFAEYPSPPRHQIGTLKFGPNSLKKVAFGLNIESATDSPPSCPSPDCIKTAEDIFIPSEIPLQKMDTNNIMFNE